MQLTSLLMFGWIFLGPGIIVADTIEMCMWVLDGAKINLDRSIAFKIW